MESGLKQRIIGALVLVAAAVIFLPMLLSGQDETERVEVEVPAEPVMDDSPLLTAQPPSLPEPVPVPRIPEPMVDTPAVVAEPVAPAPVSEPAAPAVTPAPADAAPTPPSAAAQGGWVVQQGSFSSQDNAEGLRKTLAEQGYNAYVRAASVDGKRIVRVYVGPVATRDAANRIRDELERRHQNKGMVVAYDGATRAP